MGFRKNELSGAGRTTRFTDKIEFINQVEEATDNIKQNTNYPPEIIETAKKLALAKNPTDTKQYLSPAFRFETFEEGTDYYKFEIQTKDEKEVLIPVNINPEEVLNSSAKNKIYLIFGIDSGSQEYISKYANTGHINLIIDQRNGENLQEKLNGVYVLNYRRASEKSFDLVDKIQRNQPFEDSIITKTYEEFFEKLLKQGKNSGDTFITHSNGGNHIEALQNYADKKLKDQGYDDNAIQEMFNQFRVIQFAYPSLPLNEPRPRIRSYCITGHKDCLYPTLQYFSPIVENGDNGIIMLKDFEILFKQNNPEKRTIFVNQKYFNDENTANYGSHLLSVYTQAVFGNKAPEKLKTLLHSLINNDTEIRNNEPIWEMEAFQESTRKIEKQDTISKQAILNTVLSYCEQLQYETEINASKRFGDNIPTKFTEANHPHYMVKKLGFSGLILDK